MPIFGNLGGSDLRHLDLPIQFGKEIGNFSSVVGVRLARVLDRLGALGGFEGGLPLGQVRLAGGFCFGPELRCFLNDGI